MSGEKPMWPRGFAAMDRTRVSEIASKGGKAAQSSGAAHRFTSEEARVAGRKGGLTIARKRAAEKAAGNAPEPRLTAARIRLLRKLVAAGGSAVLNGTELQMADRMDMAMGLVERHGKGPGGWHVRITSEGRAALAKAEGQP